jgi:hypothetical protein
MPVGVGVDSNTLVVLTSTFNSFVQKNVAHMVFDQVLKHNPVLYRFWRKGPKLDGGSSLIWPVLTTTKTKGGFYVGAAQLPHGVEDTIQPAEVPWRHAAEDVTIPKTDLLKARTPYAKVDLFKTKIDEGILNLRARISAALYVAPTEGNGLDHLLQICDDGSNVTTYAGISRTAYPVWKCGIASDGYVDKGGAAALSDIQDLYGRASDGDLQPTLIIARQPGYNYLWGQLQALQRFVRDEEMTKAGFESIKFNRAVVVVDRNFTTAGMLFINEEFVDLVSHEDENFVVDPILPGTPSERTINTKIAWTGNLRGKAPRYCAQLRGTNL